MQTVLNSFMEPLPSAGTAPDWVHLLPAGEFSGVDGRGPFEVKDPAALIAASMKPGRKLPIDINHATDLIAKDGRIAPAVGWIVALESRPDGVWGRVEWTVNGRKVLADKEYGYLSPVFTHPKTGKPAQVAQLLRAGLTNDPNLTLTALHHSNHAAGQDEQPKERVMEKQMREALGLPETATSEEVLKAATDRLAEGKKATEAMARIAEAAGLKKDAGETEIVTALNAGKKATPAAADGTVAALEEQIKALNTKLNDVTTASSRKDAEAAIDKAIADGKIVPALRDRLIARHMADPTGTAEEIKLMPSINAGGLGKHRPDADPATAGLTDEDAEVAQMMGLDPKKFAETAKAQKERL